MSHATADKRALTLPEKPGLSVQFDFCSSTHYNPVFTPVMVQLKGEFLARFDTDAFDFIDFSFFKYGCTIPTGGAPAGGIW